MNRNPFEISAPSVVQSKNDTLTTIHCSASFSEEMNSVVSALTFEDELGMSDRSLFNKFDPILISIDERRWSSDPTIITESRSVGSHQDDRFVSCSNHGSTKMCAMPKRRGSIEHHTTAQSPHSNKETTRELPFYKEFNVITPDIVSTCSSSEPTFCEESRASLDLLDILRDRNRRTGRSTRLIRH